MKILARRKSTLKHVDAAFHDYFPHLADSWHGLPFPYAQGSYFSIRGYFGNFDEFEALEKLLVRVPCFGPFSDFTLLLPASINTLGLRNVPKTWNGVEKLANAVSSGRLSQLKKVVLDIEDQDEFDVARMQLNVAGVTCVKYDSAHRPFGRSLPSEYICLVVLFEHLTGNDD